MLLTMALILMVGTAAAEFTLVRKVPVIRWINERSQIAGMAMSVMLSLTLGWAFGLSGLVAGVAGIGSSMITEPVFYAKRKIRQSNDKVGRALKEFRDTYYRPTIFVLKWSVIIVSSPIWIPMWFRRNYIQMDSQKQLQP